jgi:SPP1 gp7 family putative phage head morphogenesis protein
MKFDLATLARRASNRLRRVVVFKPIFTTTAQAESLALVYLRTVRLIEERRPRLVEIYERTVKQALRTDSVDELGGELDDLDRAVQRLVLELTPDLRRWALRTEEWHRGKWKRNVLDAVSVSLETMLGPEDMRELLGAFVQRNVALVRNVSDEARGRIADSVFRGFQRRASAPEISKDIREAANMARARAIRIAGDQSVKLASALDAERQRQAGLDTFQYRHSGKLHFRPEHRERDGKLYDLDTGKQVDGPDQIAPGDGPGEPPFCGCVRQAVLTFD